MSLLTELKRRNVFRIAGIYAVVGWILMQVAGTLEASLNLPEWFDSVITAGLLIGFPVALLLAWAFEMTPDGVKPTIAAESGNISTPANKMDFIIILGITSVIGLSIWQQMREPESTQAVQPNSAVTDNKPVEKIVKVETIIDASIAVLPFSDLSQAGDQEYFSDGISEEILNVLVKAKSLKVASRTSSFGYKGQEALGIPTIAKKLKVRHILEGSVRKAGDVIRITAQLIDAQTDQHLWSEAYDRPLSTESIFAIQDEIAQAIVQALKEQLGLSSIELKPVTKSTRNLSAYELFLQAKSLFIARKDLDHADKLLIKAIELDYKFADAWAMRAGINSLNIYYSFYNTTAAQDETNSLNFSNQALSLEPNNALALSARALTQLNANMGLRGKFDFNDIISDLEKSLSLEPNNATTLLWLGATYYLLGYTDESIKNQKRCIEYEPSYTPCVANYIARLSYSENYQLVTELYLKYLSSGLLDQGYAPMFALAQLDKKLAFMLVMNSPQYFRGWERNNEIYQAYREPDGDHSLLIRDAIAWISTKKVEPTNWVGVLIPLGYKPPRETFRNYDVFTFKKLNMNSDETKKYIRDANIFAYWQQYGYPPQCKPIGKDDFECH